MKGRVTVPIALLVPLVQGVRSHWVIIISVLALLFLAAGMTDSVRRMVGARNDLLAARSAYADAYRLSVHVEGTSPGSFPEVRSRLHDGSDRLEDASARLGYLDTVMPMFRWVPWVGEEIAAVPEVIEVTRELGDAGEQLVTELDVALTLHQSLSGAARELLVVRSGRVLAVLESLDGTARQADKLAAIRWSGPFTPIGEDVRRTARLLSLFREHRRTFKILTQRFDSVAGYQQPTTYLILGQNDQEIRPTGGFIGSAGTVVLADGDVVKSDFGSSLNFDPAERTTRQPPRAIVRFLGASEWYMRDANWEPDFRRSAQVIAGFVEQDRALRVDGVIAVDSKMVSLLLDALGPLTVDGFREPLTTNNWYRLVEGAILRGLENGSGERGDTLGWDTGRGNSLEAVALAPSGREGLPPGAEVTTAIRARFGESPQIATYLVHLEAETHDGSLYIYLPDDWDGGAPRLEFSEFHGAHVTPAEASLEKRGRWQRISTSVNPHEGVLSGNLRVWLTVPPSRGSELLLTLASVEPRSAPAAEGVIAGDGQVAKQAYLGPVMGALLERMTDASPHRLPLLLRAFQEGIAGRHLQMWMRDPDDQAVIAGAGADGAMDAPKGGDFLAVVDANLSYSKVQPGIVRDIVYRAGLDGGREVIVTWRNEVPELLGTTPRLGLGGKIFDIQRTHFTESPGVLGSYVRFYVPQGSEFLGASGFDSAPELTIEDEFMVVAGFVAVEAGAEKRVVLRYRLLDTGSLGCVHFWKQGGDIRGSLRAVASSGRGQTVLYDGPFTRDVHADFTGTPGCSM